MRLQAMVAAIATAMVTCIVFYSAVGALGYVAWPTTVTGNILNTLPEGNMFVQVRCCMCKVIGLEWMVHAEGEDCVCKTAHIIAD